MLTQNHAGRRNGAVLWRGLLALVAILLIATTLPATALPRPDQAAPDQAGDVGSTSPGKPGDAARAARVSQRAEAVARAGSGEVLVGFDPGPGLAKIQRATARRNTAATRAAGAAAAASQYARTKSAALASAGPGVRVVRDYDHLPIQLVRVSGQGALARLAAADGVSTIDVPRWNRTADMTAALSVIHQPAAVTADYTGSGVGVAVLDTGVDWTRSGASADLGNCTDGPATGTCRITSFHDVTNSGQNDVDPDAHGTNVSGVVARVAPSADIHVYGVFQPADDNGDVSADDGDILAALNAITRDGPGLNIRSVNMSLGEGGTYFQDECTDSFYSSAFLNLRALGIVPVVAAGNDAHVAGALHTPVGVSSPACATGAVRVGAVYPQATATANYRDCTDSSPAALAVTCFSQTGRLLSIYAPGAGINASGITMSGTSQAAPFVAGAVADLVSANPRATAQQVARALRSSRTTLTDPKDNTSAPLLDIETATATVRQPAALIDEAGCRANTFPGNDDGSVAAQLPFPVNFFGTTYESLHVNNNGNVTFSQPMATYTPFTINAQTPPMIAPFLADVDTRGVGSGAVTYGAVTFGSRQAFCVNWVDVGYYSSRTNKLNSFQLLVVQRDDIGAGDFDIIMNYGAIGWETGDASGGSNGLGGTPAGAGYSAGDGDEAHFFQFPGSLNHLALLDTNSETGLVNGSRGSLQRGRYVFGVRNGAPPGAARVAGTVRDPDGAAQPGAPVQACPETGASCIVGVTGGDGHYTIVGLAPGDWHLAAMPPAGSGLAPARTEVFPVAAAAAVARDLVLGRPQPVPAGTTITSHGQAEGGLPVLYWNEPIQLSTAACPGGYGAYEISTYGDVITSGAMTETPTGSGRYVGTSPTLAPATGAGAVAITIHCPNSPDSVIDFGVYIDPSGTVVNTLGAPVPGATVTLLRSDSAAGPFEVVPDGSAIMSPSQRRNPLVTAGDGVFHWDVLAGYYQVQASAPDCTAPGSAQPIISSGVLEVPPPALGIVLTLDCGESAPPAGQEIVFQPLPDRTYGDAPFEVAATASSGLPVGLTASGSCSVTGTRVSLTGAGSCTVSAHQAGDDSWQPAADVARTFNVATRELVVTAADQASRRGEPLVGVLASAVTGLVGSDTVTGAASCATTASAQAEPGDYPITCQLGTLSAGPNYRLTFRGGTYTILPALPVVVPAPTPGPSSGAQLGAAVKVKSVGGNSKLRVDVDPNKAKGYWTFKVQRRGADLTWKTLSKTYRTEGRKDTRTLNLGKGDYRVVVGAKYGLAGATSTVVHLKR